MYKRAQSLVIFFSAHLFVLHLLSLSIVTRMMRLTIKLLREATRSNMLEKEKEKGKDVQDVGLVRETLY